MRKAKFPYQYIAYSSKLPLYRKFCEFVKLSLPKVIHPGFSLCRRPVLINNLIYVKPIGGYADYI